MDKEKLVQVGVDYDAGVHRFGGNPQIYEKYLLKFFEKNEMPALRQALESGDYEAAFRVAHNIKGSAGNLSITAFFDQICKLVDALRTGVQDRSLTAMYAEAEALFEAARKGMEESANGSSN